MILLKDSEWDRYSHLPKMAIVCQCGGKYESQAKWVPNGNGTRNSADEVLPQILITEGPCPSCGENSTVVTATRLPPA